MSLNHNYFWTLPCSGMLSRVVLVKADVSDERIASIIRVTRIGKLVTTLAVTSNRSMLRRATRRNIPEHDILQSPLWKPQILHNYFCFIISTIFCEEHKLQSSSSSKFSSPPFQRVLFYDAFSIETTYRRCPCHMTLSVLRPHTVGVPVARRFQYRDSIASASLSHDAFSIEIL
jgi:hypothetical protein